MKIVVQKFGGSSLATSELRNNAAAHVRNGKSNGYSPVVVVSAMGRKGEPYATDTLIELVKEANPRASGKNADLLISCGEIISASVFAETLNRLGMKAQAFTGWQSGILTDQCFSNARVLNIHPSTIIECLEQGVIPVITGFQGITSQNEVTTLGRGGSDTTAAALGVVLQAEWVEIYTDVDGVKTADPRIVPDAPTLSKLTYREVVELAHLGAKVIHPRAVEIAMEEGIPLRVLSTTVHGEGTIISNQQHRAKNGGERVGDRVVTGIAHLSSRTQVHITGDSDFNKSRRALEIFDTLAQNGVSVDLIYLSPDLVAFIIDDFMSDLVKEVLSPLGLNIRVESGFAKVSIVGAGMHGVPGVMARVVASMEREGIAIHQTTDSHANISCLIREEHLEKAVRALHEEFRLSREGG